MHKILNNSSTRRKNICKILWKSCPVLRNPYLGRFGTFYSFIYQLTSISGYGGLEVSEIIRPHKITSAFEGFMHILTQDAKFCACLCYYIKFIRNLRMIEISPRLYIVVSVHDIESFNKRYS